MQRIPRTGLVLVMAALVMAVSLVGCKSGPAKGEVRGKVTFKGTPVKEGNIEFQNLVQGGAGHALIGADGGYEIKGGLVVGDYVVTVNPLDHLVDSDPGKTPAAMTPKPAPDIPPKYRTQATTSLKASVKAGKNEFSFDMKP